MPKILVLASNPRNDLKLDDEIRTLQDVIERSSKRAEFRLEKAVGVRVGDLQRLVIKHEPEIIHFCGHGSGQEGLIFKVDGGGEQWVRAEALATLFRLCASVRCVLLNACYSAEQADAIARHTDYVIGMSHTIQDNAAIAFSKGFYTGLGEAWSIERSFGLGKNAIQLEVSESSIKRSGATTVEERKLEVVDAVKTTILKEDQKPLLFIRGREQTPEDLEQLLANKGEAEKNEVEKEDALLKVDNLLGNEVEAKPPQILLPHENGELLLTTDRDSGNQKFKQYREKVKEFLSDRKLTALETIRLERLRKDLGLSEAEAKRILEEEQEPIRKARDEYEAMLIELIEAGHYPLDAETEKELQSVQQELGLSDEEVKAIEAPILVAAEEDYQASVEQEKQQEYQQKLHRYEQEFRKAIEAQCPIDDYVRGGLRKFQETLGLTDEDVARIEEPIALSKKAAYCQQLKQQQEEKEKREQEERQRQQEYENRLQRYEQEFRRAIEAQYPIGPYDCYKLKCLQQALGLSDEDVARIEAPIVVPRETVYLQEPPSGINKDAPQLAGLPTVISEQREIDYTHLQDLLMIGEWKKADQETTRRMCELMNRAVVNRKEGWLRIEDIRNFPCSDLQIINQLWLQYSNQRFGFSIQKRIWLEENRDYVSFGNRLGWRVNKLKTVKEERNILWMKQTLEKQVKAADWLNYENLGNHKAPVGHFPTLWGWQGRERAAYWFDALFSRIEACGL